ncbi:MAG TPA: hypothetical protein VGM19_08145 [Armatimonadota bacterium]
MNRRNALATIVVVSMMLWQSLPGLGLACSRASADASAGCPEHQSCCPSDSCACPLTPGAHAAPCSLPGCHADSAPAAGGLTAAEDNASVAVGAALGGSVAPSPAACPYRVVEPALSWATVPAAPSSPRAPPARPTS